MGTRNETNRVVPFMAVHPGTALDMELKERGIKQKDFAKAIGMEKSHLNELIKGKRQFSVGFCDKLEQHLGISAKIWLGMQADYEYDCKVIAQRGVEEQMAVAERDEYNKVVDVRVVLKRIGVELDDTWRNLMAAFKSAFGLSSPADIRFRGAFRKSEKTGTDERMIKTWVLIARHDVLKSDASGVFCKDSAESLVADLNVIFNENANVVERVSKTLSDYGIRFCVTEKVSHASIDGYSFLDNGVPSVVITKRYDQIDHIAFDVMHEIGHIFLHLSDDLVSSEDVTTQQEIEANKFAMDALIPQKVWSSAPSVKISPKEIQRAYSKWADSQGLNKWIVLGRIAKEMNMYYFKGDKNRNIG